MNIIKLIKKVVNKAIRLGYKLIYKFIPINDHMIVFIAYHGKGYLCNPKAIHEELTKNKNFSEYRYIWAIKGAKYKKTNIPNAKVVRYNGMKYFYYLARSKYWVVNCKLPQYVLKKKNQIYIQTWHGTPLKKLAHDINIGENATFYRTEMSRDEMVKSYDVDVAKYNYLISPNKFSTEKFESCFKIDRNKIVETGYPRNDYLVNLTKSQINLIKEKYDIPKGKKVLLYAPTWRDNQYTTKGYTINVEADFEKWKKQLSDEWIILVKPHYLIMNGINAKEEKEKLIVLREDVDINELYAITDLLVTDYSSVFFDYSILNRPILFYMYDLDEYKDMLRGFYLDIFSELPGPIIQNEDELLYIIKNKIFDKSTEQLNKFRKRFNYLDDGNAAKRVIERLIK